MTAYNHEKYIRQALDGVVNQQADFEYELLVGDDCSTDRTREILFEYQRRFPEKIRVFWADVNVYATGGNGSRMDIRCRGEYIAYCEGDDYWVNPLKLQKQIDLLRKHPSAGLCFAGTDLYSESTGETVPYDPALAPEELMSGKDYAWRNMFGQGRRGLYCQNGHTSTMLFRRDIQAEARRCFPEILSWRLAQGDSNKIYTLGAVSDICFLPERCSVYRRNPGGVTSTNPMVTMDNDFVRIYFAMVFFGWTFDESFDVFSDRMAFRWANIAVSRTPEAQRQMAADIADSPDLSKAFSRFYARPWLKAMHEGRLTRRTFRRWRMLFMPCSHLRRAFLLKRMKKA